MTAWSRMCRESSGTPGATLREGALVPAMTILGGRCLQSSSRMVRQEFT